MWKRYNTRKKCGMFRRVCLGMILAGVVGLLLGCGTVGNDPPEVAKNSMLAEPEQQKPSTVIEKPDSAKAEKTGSDEETVQEASVLKEEDADYDFGPVSYDLINLPPMENREYAAWDGCIYFRQYSDEDVEEMRWGHGFPMEAGAEKELMRMNTDGSVEQVGVNNGHHGLHIWEGRIYSDKAVKQGDKINFCFYSCALDGSDTIEYASKEVLAVRGDRIICDIGYGHGISWIDARDGQEHILIEEFDSYHEHYLGATEEEMFFSKLVENEEAEAYAYNPYDLILYSMDYQGNKRELATFTEQEYETYIDCTPEVFDGMHLNTSPLFIPDFQILGEDLYFLVGTTNGTGHVWTGGMIYGMKKDGSDCQMLVSDSYEPYFYLYDEGENRSLYFESDEEGVATGNKRMRRITLSGEPQEDITPWEADISYHTPQVRLTQDHMDSILYYPDHSGTCYVLLTAEECKKLGIETTYESSAKERQMIDQIEYLEGRLFFTVTDLIYREDWNNSQWGYGYERGRSVCYCKDMESGEIRVLYEY